MSVFGIARAKPGTKQKAKNNDSGDDQYSGHAKRSRELEGRP